MQDTSNQLLLTGRQRQLFDVLQESDPFAAQLYYNSHAYCQQADPPFSVILAAHLARELMEYLPKAFDIGLPEQQSDIKTEVNKLKEPWEQCSASKPTWDGRCEAGELLYIRSSRLFFEWYNKEQPSRREKNATLFKAIAKKNSRPPSTDKEEQLKNWKNIYHQLAGIAHPHTKKYPSNTSNHHQLDTLLAQLDYIMHDMLISPTFDDFDELDQLIAGDIQ